MFHISIIYVSSSQMIFNEIQYSFSLGALHDGENNHCQSSNRYVMATSTNKTIPIEKRINQWHFSQCSLEYFRSFISDLMRYHIKYTFIIFNIKFFVISNINFFIFNIIFMSPPLSNRDIPYKWFFRGSQISRFCFKLVEFFLTVFNFHDPEI